MGQTLADQAVAMRALAELTLACLLFVASHLAMSHPLRQRLVKAMGERGFHAAYSLVSLALLIAIAAGFHKSAGQPPLWNGTAAVPWVVASLLTIPALALVLASLMGNPALPGTSMAGLSARKPWGVFKVTRHPMMMGIALWAVAHIIAMPTPRTIVVAIAMLVLALAGAAGQDRKKVRRNAREWGVWMQRTSFWPRVDRLGALGNTWLVAVLVWLLFTWLHQPIGGIPAGIWRWL